MGYNQWILDTECDFYADFDQLFLDKGADISASKTTYMGHQFDVIGSKLIDWARLRDWTLENIKVKGVENIEILKAWCIDYHDGGYQTLHRHGKRGLSVVIFLDDQPHEGKAGSLYAVNDDIYTSFKPSKGKAVIITGGIWHGVYPCVNPRRTFVADYKIKELQNGV